MHRPLLLPKGEMMESNIENIFKGKCSSCGKTGQLFGKVRICPDCMSKNDEKIRLLILSINRMKNLLITPSPIKLFREEVKILRNRAKKLVKQLSGFDDMDVI